MQRPTVDCTELAISWGQCLCWRLPDPRMRKPWPVHCETAELAVEASALAEGLSLSLTPVVSTDALDAAAHAARTAPVSICLLLSPPEPQKLLAAAEIAAEHRQKLVIGLVSEPDALCRGLSQDLNIPCVIEVATALTCAALLPFTTSRPWNAQSRKLSATDRARVDPVGARSERQAGRLVSIATAELGWEAREGEPAIKLGHPAAVGRALSALRESEALQTEALTDTLAVDAAASRDVLFGPARLLSDPASKAALGPYGLPLPQEELCSSPSRAASEAARIGFPVRISLASPDLRVWDHPDLSVDGVDNAARVRDVYRQLTQEAEKRLAGARVLGVTVTATTLARAILRVKARPVGQRVLLRVGFADPHGAAARDTILTVWPASHDAVARALSRLTGTALVLGQTPAERTRSVGTLTTLFSQLGRFALDFTNEVERIDLNPVALLVGGGAEVREAAVQVTDAFSRGLA